MLRSQDFSIPAGGAASFSAQYRFLKMLSVFGAADPVLIVTAPRTGSSAPLRPGQGFRDLPLEENTVYLVNPTNATLTGTFICGDARFEDSRMFGNVNIVDNSVSLTRLGQQFVGSVTRFAAAGAYSMAGVRALATPVNIRKMMLFSSAAGFVGLYACTGDPTVNPSNAAGAGANKLLRAANSAAFAIRGDAAAAAPTSIELPGVFGLMSVWVPANQYTDVPIAVTPLRLAAQHGVVAVPVALNRDVSMLVDFDEVPD